MQVTAVTDPLCELFIRQLAAPLLLNIYIRQISLPGVIGLLIYSKLCNVFEFLCRIHRIKRTAG